MTASLRSGVAWHAKWRRASLVAMITLAGASALVLTGPAWVHWAVLLAALGVLLLAEESWQRAVTTAQAAGLVAGPAAEDRTTASASVGE